MDDTGSRLLTCPCLLRLADRLMEPFERVAVVLTLMQEIEAVMRQQNVLLRDVRLGRIAGLEAEKAALTRAYEAELRALRSAPNVMASLPESVGSELERATRTFQVTVGNNVKALQIGRAVFEEIMRQIGESLAAVRSRSGSPAPHRRTIDHSPNQVIAVAFDRKS